MTDFKKQIKDKGLKQKFFADKLGMSEPYFSMCLNGKKPMPEDKKTALIELLKSK